MPRSPNRRPLFPNMENIEKKQALKYLIINLLHFGHGIVVYMPNQTYENNLALDP